MVIPFYKYQGTGNDFVMIDNRTNLFNKTDIDLVREMCDRKFGVGSDGLILIENSSDLDFDMVFFNPDGSQSFCGNGSRCAVAFAKYLEIIDNQAFFNSTDGEHEAWVSANGDVSLKMHDVKTIEKGDGYYYINTGSPHYIKEELNLPELDIITEGQAIRYNDRFKEEGTNVNFVKYKQESLDIRTYERGVEGETLSCGTGVTAAALSWADKFKLSAGKVDVNAQGGKLSVGFKRTENGFNDIWLIGAATYVFKGEFQINE